MKKHNKKHETVAAAPEAPQIEQPEKPSTTAEEIAQGVITKVLARKFNEYQRHQATILAMRRMLAEHGIPDAESYNGEDRRYGGRCLVCYRTGAG